MRSSGIIFLVLILTAAACRNSNAYKEEELFFDYKITAEEGYDSASVFVQFRLRNITGPAVALNENATVMLDVESIPAGKSKITGDYYAVTKHIASISGKHSFTYISADGKKYRTSFEFHPFQLASALPDTINTEGFAIHFAGLDSVDRIQLLLTDTSFTNEGVNRSAIVKDNVLPVSPSEIAGLAPGPVQLEVEKFVELRIRRGMIVTSYVLRKEIWNRGSRIK